MYLFFKNLFLITLLVLILFIYNILYFFFVNLFKLSLFPSSKSLRSFIYKDKDNNPL